MPGQHDGSDAHAAREWWIAAALLTIAVLARSLVFVFWEQSYFDSDQAIVGLMAKHLSEGRAFPVFYYGQNYMLGVEAYLAAPVFLVAGVSVTTLKLPLLLLNGAIAVALLGILVRQGGLRPLAALVPVLFFALPSPVVAADLLAPNGGNLAPFVYAIVIWLTRNRPALCGLAVGIGFLHREFTVYALVALLAVEAVEGTLFARGSLRRHFALARTAAEVWLVVQWVKYYSSAAGPGTSMADVFRPRDNVLQLAERVCGDAGAMARGALQLTSEHWPFVFGTRPVALLDFGIDSTQMQGISGSWIVVAAALILPAAVIVSRFLRERRWHTEYAFPVYLIVIGLLSAIGYVVGRCGQLSYLVLRYDLLAVFGAVGLGALFLQMVEWQALRRVWIALALCAVSVAGVGHARLLTEYVRHAPAGAKHQILRHLEARGIKYAVSDYWLAYALTFLSGERIIVASNDFQRIPEHTRIVEAHKDEAVRVLRSPCPGGRPLMPGIYLCDR